MSLSQTKPLRASLKQACLVLIWWTTYPFVSSCGRVGAAEFI